ncbi:MAG: ABC transporter permease [Gammaproteobacteria bacterium]|nr:ABC transporter permease [Gammaproteobacteria bacterium]
MESQPVRELLFILDTNMREAFRSLYKAKLRTLLALIGIVIGIGSVIAMISLGEVDKAMSRSEFEALGTDILILKATGKTPMSLTDALALTGGVASIRESASRLNSQGKFRYGGKELGDGPIQGVTASFARVNRLKMQAGRFISDLDAGRYWCVIGADVARALRESGARQVVGETMDVGGWLFTVLGVLGETEENYSLPFQVKANQSIFVPITTLLRIRPGLDVDLVIARTLANTRPESAARDVQSWFHKRAPTLEIETTSAQQLIAQMESHMKLMTLLLAAIGSISLIVGGIGVMNIMLVAVSERRREIGIRRALGARRKDIQSQFLIESVTLTVVGGILGIVLGSTSTWIICLFADWNFFISTTACISGIAVSSVVGVFFGFQPAYKAARLDPVICLQAQ